MTKDEAKAHVQKLLAQAQGLLDEAAGVMDEHQFSVDFMDRSYFPRNLELKPYYDDDDGDDDDRLMSPVVDGMGWMYFYKSDYEWLAGKWKSSSEYKGC